MGRGRIGWLVVAALLMPSAVALASGTYRGGPPRTPASLDREAYDQGKRVFAMTADAGEAGGDRDAQLAVLEAWQAELPARVARSKDLTALAGTISDEQLEQLGYFLKRRYKIE